MNHIRTRVSTLAAIVALCALAYSQTRARKQQVPDFYAMKPEARGPFVHKSIDNTLIALRQVDAHLRKLPAKELRLLRAKVGKSIGECPYTHATFVLLAAVGKTVAEFPKSAENTVAKGAEAKRDGHLAKIQATLELQWRICQLLDVTTALAKVDVDAILRQAPKSAAEFGDLFPGDQNLAQAAALLATVKKRVDALPAGQKQGIFATHSELGPATAGLWNFKVVMIRCANELRAAIGKPKKGEWSTPTSDPITLRARALLRALQSHFRLYC